MFMPESQHFTEVYMPLNMCINKMIPRLTPPHPGTNMCRNERCGIKSLTIRVRHCTDLNNSLWLSQLKLLSVYWPLFLLVSGLVNI